MRLNALTRYNILRIFYLGGSEKSKPIILWYTPHCKTYAIREQNELYAFLGCFFLLFVSQCVTNVLFVSFLRLFHRCFFHHHRVCVRCTSCIVLYDDPVTTYFAKESITAGIDIHSITNVVAYDRMLQRRCEYSQAPNKSIYVINWVRNGARYFAGVCVCESGFFLRSTAFSSLTHLISYAVLCDKSGSFTIFA